MNNAAMSNATMQRRRQQSSHRRGSVYIAVLGTALVASTLALSALALQRIQNRQLTMSSDVRQAQLNAEAAIELGLLTIGNDENWRDTYGDVEDEWFTQNTDNGSYRLEVRDPVDGEIEIELDGDETDPVVLLGIGTSGDAEQRAELVADPRPQSADVLYATANANGILANQDDSVDWDTVLDAYQAAGVQINYNALPATTNLEFARNTSFNDNFEYWDDDPPGLPSSDITRVTDIAGHSACLYVDRNDNDDKRSGAGNRLQVDRLKPNTVYQVTIEVHPNLSWPNTNRFKVFMLTEYSDGSFVESTGSTTQLSYTNSWTPLSATITTPNWSQEPANVYLVVNSDHASGTDRNFYIDNIHVYENTTGRALYHQVLGPTVANPHGIYTIDCGGGRLVIERTRILGTLVVRNAAANSTISNGPVLLTAATSGYPVLLVDGDFVIQATNRGLNESYSGETGTNFNPSGIPYEFNNPLCSSTDSSATGINDIYPSKIQGLIAVSGNLTFANQPRVRGQVIAGGTITGAPSLEHRLDAVLNPPPEFTAAPNYERRPASARKAIVE